MSTETTTTSTAGTTTPTIAELAARLAAVEKSGRRWRMMAVVGLVLAGVMGAADSVKVPEEIRARSFVVVGRDGAAEPLGALRAWSAEGEPEQCVLAITKADSTTRTLFFPGKEPLLTAAESKE